MENFFTEIIDSIIKYFQIMVLLIFKKRRASIFLFSKRFQKTSKIKISSYAIFAYSVLFIYGLGVILDYLFGNLDSSKILEFLLKRWEGEELTKYFFILIPFVALIHLLCFIFYRDKNNRAIWSKFLIMNFSAQLISFVLIISLIIVCQVVFRIDLPTTLFVFLAAFGLIAFLVYSFIVLYYAGKYRLLDEDSNHSTWSVCIGLVLPVVFVFLVDFVAQNENSEYEFYFENKTNDRIAVLKVEPFAKDSFKFNFDCFVILKSKNAVTIGINGKKNYFEAAWPITENTNRFSGSHELIEWKPGQCDVAVKLSVQNDTSFIFLRQNEPQRMSFVGYLSKHEYVSLLMSYNFKIIGDYDKLGKRAPIYYNDSFKILKRY